MAAFNGDRAVPPAGWSEPIGPLTSSQKVRVQNKGSSNVILQAFTSNALPASAAEAEGGVDLWRGQGWHFVLGDDFPGIASATYLRAYAPGGSSTISVSHA